MLSAVVVLAACLISLELYVVNRFSILQRFIERWPIIGLGFSFVLSAFLGAFFGVAGVTIMFATVMSIAFTTVWYNVDGYGKLAALRQGYRDVVSSVVNLYRTIRHICWTVRHPILAVKAR